MVLFHGLVHAVGDMNSEKLSPIAQTARNMHLQREQFAREDEEKRLQQQNRLTQAQIDMAVRDADYAGIWEQAKLLKEELRRVAPNHYLFKQNGEHLKDGRPQTYLGAVWMKKFDEVISKTLKIMDPSRFRNC